MNRFIVNGQVHREGDPVWKVDNRGYRYGDSFFETLKYYRGRILLESLHLDRMRHSFSLLGMNWPPWLDEKKLAGEIHQLVRLNQCESLARVRVQFSHGNGGMTDGSGQTDYSIECWPLEPSMNAFNQHGLIIDIYPDGRKSTDRFSRLKSGSSLLYTLAARYAKDNKLNDCLVRNTDHHLADSSIANLFVCHQGKIITPSLDQGCIDGVMRRHIIRQLAEQGETVLEAPLSQSDLEQCEEVFLTNAIRGIRWVEQFREQRYTNGKSRELFEYCVQTLLH